MLSFCGLSSALRKFFVTLLCLSISIADGKIISKSADTTFNQRYVKNFKLMIFQDANGEMLHNVSGTLLVDLKKILIAFVIKVKSSPNRKDYDQLLFQGNVDTCKVSQGVIGNFLVRSFLSADQNSNFHFDCPMKKGFYYLYNHPNIDTSFIPAFLPKKNREWEMAVTAKTKFPEVASASQLVFVKLYGESVF